MIDEFTINIEKSQALTIPETKNLLKVDGINPMNRNQLGLFNGTVYVETFLMQNIKAVYSDHYSGFMH